MNSKTVVLASKHTREKYLLYALAENVLQETFSFGLAIETVFVSVETLISERLAADVGLCKRISNKYSLLEKGYTAPIDFGINGFDFDKYETHVYEKESLTDQRTVKKSASCRCP